MVGHSSAAVLATAALHWALSGNAGASAHDARANSSRGVVEPQGQPSAGGGSGPRDRRGRRRRRRAARHRPTGGQALVLERGREWTSGRRRRPDRDPDDDGRRRATRRELQECPWHADVGSQEGCTNDDNYPKDWLRADMRPLLFFATPEECCNSFFGGPDCPYVDRGCSGSGAAAGAEPEAVEKPVATSGGTCTTVVAGWHADKDRRDGCTDDANYPPEWHFFPNMFYPTAAACCEYFSVSLGGACQTYPAGCPVDPTLATGGCGPQWHPDVKAGSKGGVCSNAKNYDGGDLYGTAAECCAVHGRKGKVCVATDGCSGEVEEVVITPKPTPRPTAKPTKPPTREPTAHPTDSPTEAPERFYPKFGTNVCVSTKVEPPPHYVTKTYRDMLTCCLDDMLEWQQVECIDAVPLEEDEGGPTPVPGPTISPAPTDPPTPAPKVFYVQHGIGTCVDAAGLEPPYWIAETFPSIVRCCQTSFASEVCLADAYAQGYEVGPTPSPSFAPVPDIVVEMNIDGTMEIDHLKAAGEYAADEWGLLKTVWIHTIARAVATAPICHSRVTVEVTSWANYTFQVGDERTIDTAEPSGARVRRRATAPTLEFELTVRLRCDGECQRADGVLGKEAFRDLDEWYLHHIDSGATTSMMRTVGLELGLLVDDGEGDLPTVTSGSLTFRGSSLSDLTWMPSPAPTVRPAPTTAQPTTSPPTAAPTSAPTTSEPTASPTTACSTYKWYYAGDRGCTNDQNYPELWRTDEDLGAWFLSDTLEECCARNSPHRCLVTDVCDETYAPKACDGDEYYYNPTTASVEGLGVCVNGGHRPPGWTVENGFLFVYAWDCCVAYYGNALCLVKNVCV